MRTVRAVLGPRDRSLRRRLRLCSEALDRARSAGSSGIGVGHLWRNRDAEYGWRVERVHVARWVATALLHSHVPAHLQAWVQSRARHLLHLKNDRVCPPPFPQTYCRHGSQPPLSLSRGPPAL